MAVGCEDRRYVDPAVAPGTEVKPTPPSGVDVDVNTPAGRVKVDGGSAKSPVAPRREVKVDVGHGNVEVDVDGKPIVERIRERRAEEATTPTP